jgi:hypothetical protein
MNDVIAKGTAFGALRPYRDGLAVARIAPIRAPLIVAPEVTAALGGPRPAFGALGSPLVIR